MSIAALVRAMAAAGAPPEAIALAVDAIEARDSVVEQRRKKDRERKRLGKSAEIHGNSAEIPAVSEDVPHLSVDAPAPSLPLSTPPMRENNSTPPTLPNPSPTPNACAKKKPSFEEFEAVFDRFWKPWPHKVGKPDAMKAFARVAGEVEAILAGMQRYIRDKPPDRPWLNPSTFLNQRRWEDEAAPVADVYRGPPGAKPFTLQDAAAAAARRKFKAEQANV